MVPRAFLSHIRISTAIVHCRGAHHCFNKESCFIAYCFRKKKKREREEKDREEKKRRKKKRIEEQKKNKYY